MDGFRRMGMVRRDDLAVCHGTEWGRVYAELTGGMADLPRLLQLSRVARVDRRHGGSHPCIRPTSTAATQPGAGRGNGIAPVTPPIPPDVRSSASGG